MDVGEGARAIVGAAAAVGSEFYPRAAVEPDGVGDNRRVGGRKTAGRPTRPHQMVRR